MSIGYLRKSIFHGVNFYHRTFTSTNQIRLLIEVKLFMQLVKSSQNLHWAVKKCWMTWKSWIRFRLEIWLSVSITRRPIRSGITKTWQQMWWGRHSQRVVSWEKSPVALSTRTNRKQRPLSFWREKSNYYFSRIVLSCSLRGHGFKKVDCQGTTNVDNKVITFLRS